MIDRVLSFVAPHPCCGCGKLQGLLCSDCKYDIISDKFLGCVGCGRPSGVSGVCGQCTIPYSRAWCVGERSGTLEELIDQYKFERVREAHRILAGLLADMLPELPEDIVIVPVPTIASHIRQRGYDHTRLLAKELGKRLRRPVAYPLRRVTQTKQREASRAVRIKQAESAFAASKVRDTATYLLIDDIATTGATLKYAAKTLKDADARDIWVAVIARQPLH